MMNDVNDEGSLASSDANCGSEEERKVKSLEQDSGGGLNGMTIHGPLATVSKILSTMEV